MTSENNKTKIKKAIELVLTIAGLALVAPYARTVITSWTADWVNPLAVAGWISIIVGVGLLVSGKNPNRLNVAIFGGCSAVSFVLGCVFMISGLDSNNEQCQSAVWQSVGLFCFIQTFLYAVAFVFALWAWHKSIPLDLHKVLFYPLVIVIMVPVSFLPGYSGLTEELSKAFLGLLTFTQAKDLWEVWTDRPSADAAISADVDHTISKDLDASNAKVDKVTIGDLVAEGATAKSVKAKQVLAEQESAVAEAESDMTDDATGADAANPNGEPLPEDKNGSPTKER